MGTYFVMWLFNPPWNGTQAWWFAFSRLDGSGNGCRTTMLSANMCSYFSTPLLSLLQRRKINTWTLENQYLLPLQLPLGLGLGHTMFIISQPESDGAAWTLFSRPAGNPAACRSSEWDEKEWYGFNGINFICQESSERVEMPVEHAALPQRLASSPGAVASAGPGGRRGGTGGAGPAPSAQDRGQDWVHLCLAREAFRWMHDSQTLALGSVGLSFWIISLIIQFSFFGREIYLAVFDKSLFASVSRND